MASTQSIDEAVQILEEAGLLHDDRPVVVPFVRTPRGSEPYDDK